jgi:DNA-binding MarR family transcriptional regulator
MTTKEEKTKWTSFLLEVWKLSHNLGDLLDRALEGSGLSADEFGFYSVVYLEQPVTPNGLAEATKMPPTTVSSYLARLAERGHITRRRNPADGRSALVELTASGQQAFEHASRLFMDAHRAVESRLGMPVDETRKTLSRLTEAIRAAGSETA